MRRPSTVELMLVTTVVLWALNVTVSRYLLTEGFQPLAYSTLRYGAAALIFVSLTLALERGLLVARRDLRRAGVATALLFLNQLGFVYALDRTTASTVGLILGATPVFAALLGAALGIERVTARIWGAVAVSFAGVALVALGSGGELSGDMVGNLFAVATAATWAAYSIAVTPLMARYTAYRVSALVLVATAAALAVAGATQTADQELDLGWERWALFTFAVLGPLVITNVLWYRSLYRIGAARATLAANLHPFVAVVFAVVLLAETMTLVQVAGGVLIAAAIALGRRRAPVSAPRPG
ncbi:MAG: DMT family transporter [Thermoleophilia bacterium]|nr:DMT family transporter [Thermoleophilia bacterium]